MKSPVDRPPSVSEQVWICKACKGEMQLAPSQNETYCSCKRARMIWVPDADELHIQVAPGNHVESKKYETPGYIGPKEWRRGEGKVVSVPGVDPGQTQAKAPMFDELFEVMVGGGN